MASGDAGMPAASGDSGLIPQEVADNIRTADPEKYAADYEAEAQIKNPNPTFTVADQSPVPRLNSDTSISVNQIDLNQLPEGTLINYRLADTDWKYTLRIESEGQFSIWYMDRAGRFIGSIEAIAGRTFEDAQLWIDELLAGKNLPKPNTFKGILSNEYSLDMPQFNYKSWPGTFLMSHDGEMAVAAPTEITVEFPGGVQPPDGAVQ